MKATSKQIPDPQATLENILQASKEIYSPETYKCLRESFQELACFAEGIKQPGSDIMFDQMIHCLKLKEIQGGQLIYKENTPITSMFLGIRGQAAVCAQGKPRSGSKDFSIKPKKSMNKYEILKKTSSFFSSEITEILEEGAEYGSGIIKSSKHPCSVKAKTQCLIAELSKNDFENIFYKNSLSQKGEIMKIIHSLPIFKLCESGITVDNLYDHFTMRMYPKGEYILRQGDPIDKMYIILKGSVSVNIKSKLKMINKFNGESFKNNDDLERFTEGNKYEITNYYDDKRVYNLITYQNGELLGDVEYGLRSKESIFSSVSESDTTKVLEFPWKGFNSTFTKAYIKKFCDEVTKKMQYLKQRVSLIQQAESSNPGKQNKYKKFIIKKITKKLEMCNYNPNNDLSEREKGRRKQGNKSLVKFNVTKQNTMRLIHDPNDQSYGNKCETVTRLSKYSKPEYITSLYNNNNGSQNVKYKKIPTIKNNQSVSGLLYDASHTTRNFSPEKTVSTSDGFRTRILNTFQSSKRNTQFIKKKSKTKLSKPANDLFLITSPNTLSNNKSNSKPFGICSKAVELSGLPLSPNNPPRCSLLQFNKINVPKKTILRESNKYNYSKCFETNKYFYLNNNTSILSKNGKSIFMSPKPGS